MKKCIKITVLLLAAMLCGCQQNISAPTTEQPTQTTTQPAETTIPEVTYPKGIMTERYLQTHDMEEVFQNLPVAPINGVEDDGTFFYLEPVGGCSVLEGTCTDGEYMYLVLEGSNISVNGQVLPKGHILSKVDMKTWEIVAQSEPMALDHANSMCYNTKLNQLVVANCNDVNTTDNQDNTRLVTFIDPDTLQIVGTKLLDFAINAIEYSPDYDLYVVGIKGSASAFAVLDADFKELGYYEGNAIELSAQDVDCDKDYIYVGNSGTGSKHPGNEIIKVYNWNGEYQGAFKVASVTEHEAIFNYGGKYYIGFYANGGRIYEITYDYSLLGQ
jgi:hypothetical protein